MHGLVMAVNVLVYQYTVKARTALKRYLITALWHCVSGLIKPKVKVIGKLGAEPFVPFLPLLTREFDVTTLIVYVMPVFTSCLRA